MLDSMKIQRRQSEIRQALAELVGKETPTEDETRAMEDLDREYRTNETRYRAALVAEDEERREAGAELETREGREWSDLLAGFELRQAAQAFAEEGRALTGATAEVVAEMRAQGSFRGIPIPLEALEVRAGETVASGTLDPMRTMPVVDRLFADSVFSRMGGQVVNVGTGQIEWPVVTSSVAAGWAATETGDVAGPTAFATTDRAMSPDSTLGVTLTVTRKALKQSGAALEQAIRRDMQSAIRVKLDAAAFLGAGSSGEPLGVIAGASTYGITETAVDASGTWDSLRAGVVRFMTANAVSSMGDVHVLMRPEVFDVLEGTLYDSGSGLTEWDRLTRNIPAEKIAITSNALAAPAGGPPTESNVLLTTRLGGVAPIFMGLWGGVDLIRDPYSNAKSGALVLTGLITADVTVARPAQLEVLTGVQD